MKASLLALFILLVLHSPAHAHFVFVVPSEDGSIARVVFSEDLEPDEDVSIDKIAHVPLFVRGQTQKAVPVTCEKGEHSLTAKLPGTGDRLVFGSLEYGVVQRGQGKPFLLRYHAKALVGALPPDGGKLANAPLEVVPVGELGKLRFQLLAEGKPVPEAAMTVIVPGEGEKKLKTDKDGCSPVFGQSGQFGVWARHVEPSAGEAGGTKYEEVRHYPTLVVQVRAKGEGQAPTVAPAPRVAAPETGKE